MTRHVTDGATSVPEQTVASNPLNPTPLTDTMEGPEAYRLYRLCPCAACNGSGKEDVYLRRCKTCRGEGKNLELVATCGTKEAVGTALVTLTEEGEFDECPFGLMHRPEGEKGRWLLKPWLPSARNVSDAGRILAGARQRPVCTCALQQAERGPFHHKDCPLRSTGQESTARRP